MLPHMRSILKIHLLSLDILNCTQGLGGPPVLTGQGPAAGGRHPPDPGAA
jgi:hypothetical protein